MPLLPKAYQRIIKESWGNVDQVAILIYFHAWKQWAFARQLPIFLIVGKGHEQGPSPPPLPAGGTYGDAVGQARAGGVATRRALALQDAVVQQVPRPLRGEGGAFALHDAQLTHHTRTWKKKKTHETRLVSSNSSPWLTLFPRSLCLISRLLRTRQLYVTTYCTYAPLLPKWVSDFISLCQ